MDYAAEIARVENVVAKLQRTNARLRKETVLLSGFVLIVLAAVIHDAIRIFG